MGASYNFGNRTNTISQVITDTQPCPVEDLLYARDKYITEGNNVEAEKEPEVQEKV